MRLYKIKAIMYSDFLVLKNSKWKLAEYFYIPVTTIIIWALFLASVQNVALQTGLIVLVVNIFWNFALVGQMAVNQEMNEDVWSGSFRQIIATGISEFEYLFARLFYSVVMTSLIAGVMFVMSLYVFNISIIAQQTAALAVFSVATVFASLGMAILLAATIITVGREYNFLAWTALQIFILLSAPFYPISVFPEAIQPVAAVMPYTSVFEGVRSMVITGTASSTHVNSSLAAAFAYFFISLPIYWYAFRRARKTGGLIRFS